MKGLHPNADRITRHLTGFGVAKAGAIAAARLGRPFAINDKENRFITRLREAYRDYNTTVGNDPQASYRPDIRARIRTALGREMFAETYARPPADDRELSGFIASNSRAATTAVAGYDLTFTPVKSVSTLWAIAPAPIARVDRGLPPSSRGRNPGISRRTRRVFPHGRPRCRPSQHHRIDRRRLRSPRLTRR